MILKAMELSQLTGGKVKLIIQSVETEEPTILYSSFPKEKGEDEVITSEVVNYTDKDVSCWFLPHSLQYHIMLFNPP